MFDVTGLAMKREREIERDTLMSVMLVIYVCMCLNVCVCASILKLQMTQKEKTFVDVQVASDIPKVALSFHHLFVHCCTSTHIQHIEWCAPHTHIYILMEEKLKNIFY